MNYFVYSLAILASLLSGPLLAQQSSEQSIPMYSIEILEPSDQTTFQSSQEMIPVSVQVMPALPKGAYITLYVDAKLTGEPSQSTALIVPRLDRGSHTLQAKMVQPNGPEVQSSIITIYQHRTNILLPDKR